MARASHFELFDHTADLGIRVTAPTPADLVPAAVDGLYAAIGELRPTGGAAGEPWAFERRAVEPSLAVRDLLQSLIVLFESRQAMVRELVVEAFDEHRLSVTGRAVPVDGAASALLREVKAVTYHGLLLRPVSGGFEAEFIVDI